MAFSEKAFFGTVFPRGLVPVIQLALCVLFVS